MNLDDKIQIAFREGYINGVYSEDAEILNTSCNINEYEIADSARTLSKQYIENGNSKSSESAQILDQSHGGSE